MKKASIIGLLIGLVMAAINIVGLFCGCFSCLNCIIMFVPGALSAHLLMSDGVQLSNVDAAKIGAVSGITSTIFPLIVTALAFLLGGTAMVADAMSRANIDSSELALGSGVLIITFIIMVPISLAFSAGANALSAFLFMLTKNH